MERVDWNHVRAFHAVAATGSLSAAARRLGLTQPTLSRQIMALEADLGVTLFERLGRRLVLTETGAGLLEPARLMGEAAETVALAAGGRVQEISGRVCITATDAVAAYLLPEIVARIRIEAPQITTVILASNELSNLHRREADIAIRHVRPGPPGLIGQRIRDGEAAFYASETWVERHGLPKSADELAGADLIGFDDTREFATYLNAMGLAIEAGDFRLVSASSVVVWEMVKQGLGVAAMIREIAERTPGVVRVLPDLAPVSVPMWLVTHQAMQNSPRIRLVQRILAEALAGL